MIEQEKGFGIRLRQRREHLGMRKQELASCIGVSLTTIQQYENGQMPKGEFAVRLGQALHCSLDWLLAGQVDKQNNEEDDINRLIFVPMVEARIANSSKDFEILLEHVSHYAFRYEFLRKKGSPGSMVLLKVAGNSMHSHIVHNDLVLIDQSQTCLKPGHIYAVGIESLVYLKTVDAMPGKIILSSSNSEYNSLEINSLDCKNSPVCILGKALWLGRELL